MKAFMNVNARLLDNCIDQQTRLGFKPLAAVHDRLVAEKSDAYSTKLYGPHADLLGTYMLYAALHERHPTLSCEIREHHTQYLIHQPFTA